MNLRYFTPEADPKLFKCGCGKCDSKPSDELLIMADRGRALSGVPWVITSGPRCQAYNDEISDAKFSEHVDKGRGGLAIDVACSDSRSRHLILEAARQLGITRIGVAKTFIHLGISTDHDQSVTWLY